jgi:zinc transport system substrate-binding protein
LDPISQPTPASPVESDSTKALQLKPALRQANRLCRNECANLPMALRKGSRCARTDLTKGALVQIICINYRGRIGCDDGSKHLLNTKKGNTMRHMRFVGLIILIIGIGGVAAAQPLQVFVSIVPQQYFVQQIGGNRVAISVMVPPGADPHSYEPKPQQMIKLAAARIYFAIGISFEKAWLPKIAGVNSHMLIVHTDDGIEKLPVTAYQRKHAEPSAAQGAVEKSEEGQDHEILDPHIWLSPPLVKIQARHIFEALAAVDPAARAIYEANYERFAGRIDALDADLRRILAGKQGLQFMVFHPSWGYFAHTYGLEQVPIEIEGKQPKAAQLAELIEHARARGIRVIFVQPQFSTSSAEVVARAIDGTVIAVDPLALDWAANLRTVATAFQEALR